MKNDEYTTFGISIPAGLVMSLDAGEEVRKTRTGKKFSLEEKVTIYVTKDKEDKKIKFDNPESLYLVDAKRNVEEINSKTMLMIECLYISSLFGLMEMISEAPEDELLKYKDCEISLTMPAYYFKDGEIVSTEKGANTLYKIKKNFKTFIQHDELPMPVEVNVGKDSENIVLSRVLPSNDGTTRDNLLKNVFTYVKMIRKIEDLDDICSIVYRVENEFNSK